MLLFKSQYLCNAINYGCNESIMRAKEKYFSSTAAAATTTLLSTNILFIMMQCIQDSYFPDEEEVQRFIKSHIFINEAFSHAYLHEGGKG